MKALIRLTLTSLVALQMNFAQATPNSDSIQASVDAAIMIGIGASFLAIPAHHSYVTKPLIEQQRALLAEMDRIPATKDFQRAVREIRRLDKLLENLPMDYLSKPELLAKYQPMIDERLQMAILRASSLRAALDLVPEKLLRVTDNELHALRESTDSKLREVTQKIARSKRGMRVPLILGSFLIVVSSTRENSVGEILADAISSMTVHHQDYLMDRLSVEIDQYSNRADF